MAANRKLTQRGPNATTPAKLPGLQGMRLADPQAQKAFEALREWVEVRLGARGDAYERAITRRELEQVLEPIQTQLDETGAFDGDIADLKATAVTALSTEVRTGGFVLLTNGELYFGAGSRWMRVTLTAP